MHSIFIFVYNYSWKIRLQCFRDGKNIKEVKYKNRIILMHTNFFSKSNMQEYINNFNLFIKFNITRIISIFLPINISMYKGVSQPCIDIAQQMKYLSTVCTRITCFLSSTVLYNRLSSILKNNLLLWTNILLDRTVRAVNYGSLLCIIRYNNINN